MRCVKFGIRLSEQRSWFAQPETQLSKQPLALSHTQLDAILLINPSAQSLTVPNVSTQPDLSGFLTKGSVNADHLFLTQPAWTSRAGPFNQSRQTLGFKAVHPIQHGARCIPQQSRYIRTSHPLGHQQHAMQTVVIAGFFRSTNLILQSKYNRVRVINS